MKAYSKEFEEVRTAFENTVKNVNTNFYLPNIKRSEKTEKNSFYDSGETDKFFQMFMQGYEYAKLEFRLNEWLLLSDNRVYQKKRRINE